HHAQQHSDQRISGGIAGFGANPGKILIQSRFGDNASNIGKCRVPCDYIPKRSYPLFRTRQILNDWLTQNLEEA
ncbi:hypothetical protein, partial [Thiolapillus sp.]|uniref:hypothetical protein n=1 Tax=Thiolapillus sp. TaxID=2017437 RepID=UPI003AF9DD9D